MDADKKRSWCVVSLSLSPSISHSPSHVRSPTVWHAKDEFNDK